MELLYQDTDLVVAIKPPRVLSTNEPGGMPQLLRAEPGLADVQLRTVHRLDRVASGLMVLAKTPQAASELSRQVRQSDFAKEYLAVLHGTPQPADGTLRDLLFRDTHERKTYVTQEPGKGVQQAILHYRTLEGVGGLSLVHIRLVTGRTHQIRCQFSSRGLPLAGDRKYSLLDDPWELALWSCRLQFVHPATGKAMDFAKLPPEDPPWSLFSTLHPNLRR